MTRPYVTVTVIDHDEPDPAGRVHGATLEVRYGGGIPAGEFATVAALLEGAAVMVRGRLASAEAAVVELFTDEPLRLGEWPSRVPPLDPHLAASPAPPVVDYTPPPGVPAAAPPVRFGSDLPLWADQHPRPWRHRIRRLLRGRP
jgi:hypothetical protein